MGWFPYNTKVGPRLLGVQYVRSIENNASVEYTYIVAESLTVLDSSRVEDVIHGDDRNILLARGVRTIGQLFRALVLDVVNITPVELVFYFKLIEQFPKNDSN